jgi:type I site-specific restriction-modification system R (restriction) subunit
MQKVLWVMNRFIIESRTHLRELLKEETAVVFFLTTIHKFTEDTRLLTDRTNVILYLTRHTEVKPLRSKK